MTTGALTSSHSAPASRWRLDWSSSSGWGLSDGPEPVRAVGSVRPVLRPRFMGGAVMIDRLALGFSRAADTAEHIAVHHFWPSISVIGLPVIACIVAVLAS